MSRLLLNNIDIDQFQALGAVTVQIPLDPRNGFCLELEIDKIYQCFAAQGQDAGK